MTAILTVQAAVRAALAPLGEGLFGVACSGGADSMALADAAIEVAGAPHVIVVVIDHALSVGSDRVAAEVVAWARSRGAAGVARRVVVGKRASIEAAAREARYAALVAVGEEVGASAILVGHTARDQVETVLMRLLRGTGPAGLAAMHAASSVRVGAQPGAAINDQASPKSRPTVVIPIVRPLLSLDRATTERYAEMRTLPVWDDPMNADIALLRVRVRREILPALRRENPQLDAALLRLADSAREWLAVIDALAAPWSQFPIDCVALAAQPPAIRKRAVALALEGEGAAWDAAHLDAIDDLILAPTRGEVSLDLPGGRFVRGYDTACWVTDDAVPVARAVLVIPEGCEVRSWQAGDRMRPARLGGKSRKLSDLFGDAKVPRSSRVSARVIVRRVDAVIVWADHIGIAHDSLTTAEERQILAANPL